MAARSAAAPHPQKELERLRSHLASSGVPRALLVKGEERYFRDRAVDLVCALATERELEVSRHDARDPEFDAAAVCHDLSAAPMFAPGRLVLVRNFGALLRADASDDVEASDGSRGAAVSRAIQSALADRASTCSVAVDSESLRADHAVSKAIAASGGPVFAFRRMYDSPPPWGDPDPRRTELVQWLLSRAQETSVRLAPDQAVYVAAAVGSDLAALDVELERLKRRGAESVQDTVAWTSGASPFAVAEHLVRGDLAPALAGIEALFRSGTQKSDGSREVEPAAIVAMLSGSVRNKLRQTVALAEGESPGGMAPRAREELEARVRLRSSASWRRMQEEFAALERSARMGATVDANDLAGFALRWRSDSPLSTRARATRMPR